VKEPEQHRVVPGCVEESAATWLLPADEARARVMAQQRDLTIPKQASFEDNHRKIKMQSKMTFGKLCLNRLPASLS